MNPTKFLLLAITSLSLIACAGQPTELSATDEGSDTLAQDGDLVRFDIEIVGDGQVTLVEPYLETCDTADGICSFVFERGTRVVFTGEAVGAVDGPAMEEGSGLATHALALDESQTLVADFASLGGRIEGPRPFGFLPGSPWIIIDTFTGDADSEREAADRAQSAAAE